LASGGMPWSRRTRSRWSRPGLDDRPLQDGMVEEHDLFLSVWRLGGNVNMRADSLQPRQPHVTDVRPLTT
jgi:hypothetical protein